MQSFKKLTFPPISKIEDALSNLENEENYRILVDIFEVLREGLKYEPTFLSRYLDYTQVFYTSAFPQLFNFCIQKEQHHQLLYYWINIFVQMCQYMVYNNLIFFKRYLSQLLDIIKEIIFGCDYFFTLIRYVDITKNYNIYYKYLIDQIVQVNISLPSIIPFLIDDIQNHASASENSDTYNIFIHVFPVINKTLLLQYEREFSKFQFVVSYDNFDAESMNMTKSLSLCSVKYAPLHFENLIKFINVGNTKAQKDLVIFLADPENFNAISDKISQNVDILLSKIKNEEILNEIASILLTNKVITNSFLVEKAGFDLFLNLIFFEYVKESLTVEKVAKIIESQTLCDSTFDFGFKLIQYKIDLMPNAVEFLRSSFSHFWNEGRMNTIIFLAKREANRQILLDTIRDYKIQNQKDYEIIKQILMIIKPSQDEFVYDEFVQCILEYTDSLFILPFLKSNPFIPIKSIDIELLVSYSVFNQEFADFLLEHFSDALKDHIEFFFSFSIDDDADEDDENNSSKNAYGRFLFELYKRNNYEDNRLIWEAIIRLEDTDEEIHQVAQKIIDENPEKIQKEITEIIEDNSKYFINFDFSKFSEISTEENGSLLIFNKPSQPTSDSFFSVPSKIRYALNHSEPINEQDLLMLFEFRVGDPGIDATILNTAFDAAVKLNINFPLFEESIILSLSLKYRTFLDKLFDYIINSTDEFTFINVGFLNSIIEFDENYAVKLVENHKINNEVLYDLLRNQQSPKISLFLSKTNCHIPIDFLKIMIYSKQDFIEFVSSNRIQINELLPFVFSNDFPQFYRTKRVMSFVFDFIKLDSGTLLNYLKTRKWKPLNKNNIESENQNLRIKNFVPFIKSTKYFNVYLAFARVIPFFNGFRKAKYSTFLSNLIYSSEGEENFDLVAPINELKNGIQSIKMEQTPEYFIDKFINTLISKLPMSILKHFEILYFENNFKYSLNSPINHVFSMKINSPSISDQLKNYQFINKPNIVLFKILPSKDFKIERQIKINGKLYKLSSIITNSYLFVPHKEVANQYAKWTNGEKILVDSIEEQPLFMFYQFYEYKENDEYSNKFYKNKNQFDKFKTTKFIFNERAIICDSLNKGNINWKNWTIDNNLFELAVILFTHVGYSGLLKELSHNVEFSQYFFKSNWKGYFSIFDVKDDLASLAKIYPNREELQDILFSSIKDENRQHFISIILSSLDLNEEYIERVIQSISPNFDNFEEFLINYFMKKTTTNKLLLNNDKLAEFILNRVENINFKMSHNSIDTFPFAHLLNPMTEHLFILCLKHLNKSSSNIILSLYSKSTSHLLKALTNLQHNDTLASIYCQVTPTCKEEFRNDIKWVEYTLSSRNSKIRNHTYSIFKSIFDESDSELLQSSFNNTILNTLFMPYFKEVLDFICYASGVKFIRTSGLITSIYNKIFSLDYIHENQTYITKFISESPPASENMIPRWKSILETKSKDVLYILGPELLVISIRCCFKPSPTYFGSIIQEIAMNHRFDQIESILTYCVQLINDDNVHDYLRMIIEFEKLVPYYIQLIDSIFNKVKEFRETQLIIMAIILPFQAFSNRTPMDLAFAGFNNNGKIYLSSFEIANKALSLVIDKKAFIRYSNKGESDVLMTRLYSHYLNRYFVEGLPYLIKSFLEYPNESKTKILKQFLIFLKLCAIAFKESLLSIFNFVEFSPGLTIFGSFLKLVEDEWSDLICEISRIILSDISFNTSEYRCKAVAIVDREMSTELYHFNSANKNYLRFLIGVLKNDQLTEETSLKYNNQIFNVLRNDFIMYIDDIFLFIQISMQKYPDFFNDVEFKKFVMNLKIDNFQIKEKLKIVHLAFENRTDKIAPLINEIFPKIEELTNSGIKKDSELDEILNTVFEKALEILISSGQEYE